MRRGIAMKPARSGDGVWRGISTLMVGSLAAKAIALLSTPIIARLYSPGDFGLLAVFSSWIVLATPFLTLKYSQAIPLARSKRVAADLLQASLLLCGLASVLGGFAVIVLSHLRLLPEWTQGSWIVFAVGPALALLGLVECSSAWLLRHKDFPAIAKLNAGQSFVGATAKVLLGYFGGGASALVAGQILQQAGAGLFALGWIGAPLRGKPVRLLNVVAALKLMRDQPLFRLPSQVLLALATQVVVLFFSKFYGAATTGQLAMALAIISLPVALMSQSSGQVFYAEAARIGRRDPARIFVLAKGLVFKLSAMGIAPVAVLLVLGERLFVLILGAKWAVAGQFAAVLAPSLLAQFASAPLVGVYGVLGRQSVLLRTNLIRLVLVGIAFGAGLYFELSPLLVLCAYSTLLTLHYCVFCVATLRMLKRAAHEVSSAT
jgi:O-antigen/teichoic acid export membrane protein